MRSMNDGLGTMRQVPRNGPSPQVCLLPQDPSMPWPCPLTVSGERPMNVGLLHSPIYRHRLSGASRLQKVRGMNDTRHSLFEVKCVLLRNEHAIFGRLGHSCPTICRFSRSLLLSLFSRSVARSLSLCLSLSLSLSLSLYFVTSTSSSLSLVLYRFSYSRFLNVYLRRSPSLSLSLAASGSCCSQWKPLAQCERRTRKF